MISYVLPTHNRPEVLARTLAVLGQLPPHDAEVVVVDNASSPPAPTPMALPNGLPVVLVIRPTNEGAAARNAGVDGAAERSEWVVMLDDDSHPADIAFLEALRDQPADVAAVSAEILLGQRAEDAESGRGLAQPGARTLGLTRPVREAGGLPEVFVGCGVAIRRTAFIDAGGYDPEFHYYAEEYDLAAKLILAGHRIVMDRRFRVVHEKTPGGRSMDTILRRLVRNNAWVMQRYAPDRIRKREISRTIRRYGMIALKERAELGYAQGLADIAFSIHRQPRREMNQKCWERFTGLSACRRSLLRAWGQHRFATAAIVAPGKNEHVVRECLKQLGVRSVADESGAEALVIGTLSPGPMLDALGALAADRRVIAPWDEVTLRPSAHATLVAA